jgi:hypothetical protein
MSSSPLVGMTDRSSSNPLKKLERVKGIEPSSSAWKAVALPLSYTRISLTFRALAAIGQEHGKLVKIPHRAHLRRRD